MLGSQGLPRGDWGGAAAIDRIPTEPGVSAV